jgi:hypothetical protein
MKSKKLVIDETTEITSEIKKVIRELSKKREAPKFDFNLRVGSYGIKKFKKYFE